MSIFVLWVMHNVLLFYMNNSYYKIMALDYGDTKIGIALSDLTRTIAGGFENYKRVSLDRDLQHIQDIIDTNNVKKVIIGLPLNMKGEDSSQSLKTREFARQLESKLGITPEFYDERLTSKLAEKVLISANVSREKRKQLIDKMSATIILQNSLDSKN